MNSLSQRVERNLIQQIKQKETQAGASQSFIMCDDYIALANLYRSNQLYQKELAILTRFINLGLALHDDLEKVEQRLNQAKARLHEQRQQNSGQNLDASATRQTSKVIPLVAGAEQPKKPRLELALEEIDDGKENLWQPIPSTKTNYHAPRREKKLPENSIKLVSICAAYTGKRPDDELFELALIAFDYCLNNDMVMRIVDEYHGLRLPSKDIPASARLRFGVNQQELKSSRFDSERIHKLLEGSQSVISHNDPVIERQLFLCHFPAYSKLDWRSSQVDIPWKALGFEATSLSTLASYYQIRSGTRTPTERAKTIVRLLAQFEPESDHTFLKRLMSCSPMSPMKWSEELRNHSKKLNRRGLLGLFGS